MANLLQIKRGTKATLPTLAAGELGFCTDTYELYVGDGAANRFIGSPNVMKGINYSLIYAVSLAINWDSGSTQYVTLTGSPTLSTPTNPLNGQVYRLRLIQDAIGSRTVIWWAGIIWAGGSAPTLTTTATKQDIITLLYSNGVYYADCTKNF